MGMSSSLMAEHVIARSAGSGELCSGLPGWSKPAILRAAVDGQVSELLERLPLLLGRTIGNQINHFVGRAVARR